MGTGVRAVPELGFPAAEVGSRPIAKSTQIGCNLYMGDTQKTLPGWLVNLRNSYAIHNVLAMRPELPFWVVRWCGEKSLEWMEMTDPRQRIKPFHFEIYFGKENVRDQHYAAALSEAMESEEPVVRELYGFSDLFYRLPVADDDPTFLYTGQFVHHPPNWESIVDQWRVLTGLEPASANPDFARFVRMTLDIPSIDTELLSALKAFVMQYGAFIAGAQSEDVFHERVDELNRDFFSRLWPIDDWVDSAISSDKFHLTPWYHEGKLTAWMKEGMGITRMPTRAMALMPLDDPGAPIDPVNTLVRNAQIQRAVVSLTREIPNTAATPLSDYGVSIITSAKRGKNAARSRVQLRELAQRCQAHLREHLNVQSVAGIGPEVARGASLHTSHRLAVVALHMCVQLDQEVLFSDEHPDSKPIRYIDLQESANAIMEALGRESTTEVKLASDLYVRQVLSYCDERVEMARGQFLATLFQLFRSVVRRYPLRQEARDHFIGELASKIEEAPSLYQLIEAFKQALSRLSFVSSKAFSGPKLMRIETTLQFLRDNFSQRLPLPEVARKACFSVPAFSRVFKQATGESYVSYLRAIRVNQAKKLLVTTPMTTDEIAQSCGFQSQHHLIRSFKKVTSQTPGAYRKEQAQRCADET